MWNAEVALAASKGEEAAVADRAVKDDRRMRAVEARLLALEEAAAAATGTLASAKAMEGEAPVRRFCAEHSLFTQI